MGNRTIAETTDPESTAVVIEASNPHIQPPAPIVNPQYSPVIMNSAGQSPAGVLTNMEDSYSWNKEAVEQASIKQDIDLKTAESNALASRQNIEKNLASGQRQAMLGKYTAAQSNERMGWTGGYALDTSMQMEFLKATIQADMYGQLELQKMGYESQLAIARLNYDLNMKQLAHQYYLDAQTIEIQRAQVVGEYISPENREMITQYQAASAALLLNPNDARAKGVVDTIKTWYYAEGLDDDGIEGLVRIAGLTRNEQAWELNQAQLDKYQWEVATANEDARQEIIESNQIPVEVWTGGEPGQGVMSIVGIDPNTTNAADMEKAYAYMVENPDLYEDILDAKFNLQYTAFEAQAQEADGLKTYEEWLEAQPNDDVADFINKYMPLDTDGNLIEYVDPKGASYAVTDGSTDRDLDPAVSEQDLLNEVSVLLTNDSNMTLMNDALNGLHTEAGENYWHDMESIMPWSMFQGKNYNNQADALEDIDKQIRIAIGSEGIDNMANLAISYAGMTDAQINALTPENKATYIKATEFTQNLVAMEAAAAQSIIDGMNPWNSGWSYYKKFGQEIESAWSNVGTATSDAWQAAPILGILTAVGTTIVASGQTVAEVGRGFWAAVVGLFKKR